MSLCLIISQERNKISDDSGDNLAYTLQQIMKLSNKITGGTWSTFTDKLGRDFGDGKEPQHALEEMGYL
jgi:hypothetical protein